MYKAGEIQAYIKSGARLGKRGFEWHKSPRVAQRQIAAFAYIRGLQAQVRFLSAIV